MDTPHPVVAIAKVDQALLKPVPKGLTIEDVYFVALMSKCVRMNQKYLRMAGDYFPPGSMIKSGEPIFLETRFDLSPIS